MTGETARVQRLVRAHGLIEASGYPPNKRVRMLTGKVRAVLAQLSAAETAAYYAAVQRVRLGDLPRR